MEGCYLCNQKPIFSHVSDPRYLYHYDIIDSTTIVTQEDCLTCVRIGADENGRIGCFSEGEEFSKFYYFNYCPNCGRKLQ